jgi:hypothetical protein
MDSKAAVSATVTLAAALLVFVAMSNMTQLKAENYVRRSERNKTTQHKASNYKY